MSYNYYLMAVKSEINDTENIKNILKKYMRDDLIEEWTKMVLKTVKEYKKANRNKSGQIGLEDLDEENRDTCILDLWRDELDEEDFDEELYFTEEEEQIVLYGTLEQKKDLIKDFTARVVLKRFEHEIVTIESWTVFNFCVDTYLGFFSCLIYSGVFEEIKTNDYICQVTDSSSRLF